MVGATGFEPVTSSVSDPTSLCRHERRIVRDREGSSESRRRAQVSGPEPSDDPLQFSNDPVSPYDDRLLPVCCPDAPSLMQLERLADFEALIFEVRISKASRTRPGPTGDTNSSLLSALWTSDQQQGVTLFLILP